jgi:hypothetical protein
MARFDLRSCRGKRNARLVMFSGGAIEIKTSPITVSRQRGQGEIITARNEVCAKGGAHHERAPK